jgi:hypothetical protein
MDVGRDYRKKNNYTVFHRCHKKGHAFGTGFILNKRIKHLIIDFNAKSPRMCRLRVRGQFLITV